MSLVVSLLLFTAISTTVAVALCGVMGSLNAVISWVSFVIGAVAGGYVCLSVKRIKPESSKKSFFDWLMFFCFSLFCLRHFLWLYFYRSGEIRTLNICNYGDLPYHLTNIAYFANGAKFWPDNPIFASEKMHYPFGVDFFTAMFVKVGMPLENALPVIGLTACFLMMLALFWWSRGFGIAAFLFSGGLAGHEVFLTGAFKDYQADLAWKSLPVALLVPQRGFLFAFPAGLILLWSWRRRFLLRQPSLPVFVEGLLWGLMPLFHFYTFLFLSFIFLIWAVSAKGCYKEAFRIFLWAVVPATFEVLALSDYFRLRSIIWWKPGWMIGEENPIFFLMFNFGLFFPLVLLTLFLAWKNWFSKKVRRSRGLQAKDHLLLLCPGLFLWVILFFVMFAPWDWDNMKLMVWCYLLILPPIYGLVIQRIHPMGRLILYVMLFLSGFVVMIATLKRENRGFQVLKVEEFDEVSYLTHGLDRNARFVIKPTFNHPVSLCGFKVVAGYRGHLWTHGLRSASVEDKVEKLMMGDPDWRRLASELGGRYLFWGLREKHEYQDSEKPWEGSVPRIASGKWGDIYDLSADLSRGD